MTMDETTRSAHESPQSDELPLTEEEQAAAWFLRSQQGRLSVADEAALQEWLAASPEHVTLWEQTQQTWEDCGSHAMLPELVLAREQALASVRRAQVKRWTLAGNSRGAVRLRAFAAVAAVCVLAVLLSLVVTHRGDVYVTGIGEQRTILLADDSRLTLDALTRVRVRYDDKVRAIDLLEGQAQFEVAKNKNRPFRVRAGDEVIEALGTSFTVEYIGDRIQVALLEGRVRVESHRSAAERLVERVIESPASGSADKPRVASRPATVLNPGDALRIDPSGDQVLNENVDVAAAVAWRQGKVIFQREPLRIAVERLNRYSRVQLKVADPTIEQWPVSGVFGASDAEAFAEALAEYFPIQSQHADDVIELRARR
ncbi:FecR family protein [Steroidobacter sp.]|uniref:FecR family protein n=1 Tax=Steroidobacter sp. TaxID=1978227 RepID=UPI001A53DA00|nr:FecR domain-containing protein [Steroidobacter sp.]MBL8269484.1 FecR domain-containing protein [Steroidobacter sp.]